MNNISSNSEKKLTVILTVVLSCVFLSLVWNNNVWMDEAFSASLVNTDFAGVIKRSMADTLPPLYNIFLKLMTSVFGYTTYVMKITSVIPMILTLILGAVTVRKRFGIKTAVLFMLSITFMPLVLYYGVEIRMYSLGFFFATASGVYAYEVFSDPSKKNMALFVIFSVLAGYSHHFAFITVAFAYLYLLLYYFFYDRKNIKIWFKCLGGTFVLYIPCLIVTLRQFSMVSGYFSMPDVDLKLFVQYMIYPYTVGITPVSVLCILVMAAALIVFASGYITGKDRGCDSVFAILCFSVYYGVLIFGTIISKIMSANIFVDRYLFFSVGLLWLSAAILLTKNNKLFYAAVAAVVIIGVSEYVIEFKTEYGNSADEEILFLRENIKEGDIYYSIGGHEEMQNCIPFYTYLDAATPDLTFIHPLKEAVKTASDNKTTLWITVLDGYDPTDEESQVLRENGLSMEKMADFEFDRYRCEMYKVTR